MRWIYLFITLLCFSEINISAQDEILRNHPKYYQDGDLWVQALVPYDFEDKLNLYIEDGLLPKISLLGFYVQGDTIIDNKEYKCVQAINWNSVDEPYYRDQPQTLAKNQTIHDVLFVREDSECKQWRRLSYLDDEAMLFDFSHPFETGQKIKYCKHNHLNTFFYNSAEKSYAKSAYLRATADSVEVRVSDEKAPMGYKYYELEVRNIGTFELMNGKEVALANGHIAYGWGDINYGDLWNQFLPDEESLDGRFLFRIHQGDVVLQNQNNLTFISDILGTNVMQLIANEKTSIQDLSATQVTSVKNVNGIFDLSGRRLSTPPAKGVYIEKGRKRLTIEH